MGLFLRHMWVATCTLGFATTAFGNDKADDEVLKQLHSSTPMKVRGKKTYSEIDSNPGPSDTDVIFNNANDYLKNIPKSKALMYQPERILGLPSIGLPLTLDSQIQ